VAALKEQWQEQRQHRQNALAERQQQVRNTLSAFREERSEKAAQLRDDLSLFQLELQQDVYQFLSDTSEQRQANAAQLMQRLNSFTADLQAQTAQFLTLTSADRALMAQQLSNNLSAFHHDLIQSVISLREALQERMQSVRADVQALRVETQILLELQHEERLQRKEEVAQELAAFIEALQGNVHIYLGQLETLRHERAADVRDMLQRDREQRSAEMDELFLELGQFRGELKGFCAELRSTVWGNGSTTAPAQAPKAPVAKPAPTRAKAFAKVQPKTQTKAKLKPISTMRAAIAKVKSDTPVVQTVAAVSMPEPPNAKSLAESSSAKEVSIPVTLSAESAQSTLRDAVQIEKEIYEHIHDIHGARLNEIESALGISRFQAVDALRSLIKKGQVTQRDRIYLVQEEVSL
jgi:gas vesicle GvpC-like protein